jgi:hypothetical protein
MVGMAGPLFEVARSALAAWGDQLLLPICFTSGTVLPREEA